MKPWTLRLYAITDGPKKIAYAGPMGRFWTRRGAQREADALNKLTSAESYRFEPVKTPKEPW